MRELALYMHPADWLATQFRHRLMLRLRFRVVLDRRCPPGKAYLGRPLHNVNGHPIPLINRKGA